MNLGISDRVALVTGASAGIGFAIAQEFIENHASVIIVARGAARLRAAEAALRSQTTKQVLAIVADVASPDAPQSIIDQVVSQFGQLDILVNNAGRAHAGGLLESSEQDWTEMTDIKLSAMRRLCKAAIPVMRAALGANSQYVFDRGQVSEPQAIHLTRTQRGDQQFYEVFGTRSRG
jgi:3-oxoacyl-[acyl-carrier protein] reductase